MAIGGDSIGMAAAPEEPVQPVVAASPADQAEVDPARAALVKRWTGRVKAALKYHEKAFKRIKEDQQLATFGAPKAWIDADKYVVPITLRHINNVVGALYAKNPSASVQVKPRIDNKIWDGTPEELQAAMASMQAGMMGMGPLDPMASAIIQDAVQVQQHRKMLKKMGKTLEILFDYYLDESIPRFKVGFKQAVRRAKVCGVAYVKIGFQRIMQADPDVTAKLEDVQRKIEHIQGLLAKAGEGEIDDYQAEHAELQLSLQDLQSRTEILVREGPVLSFPRATAVVVDPHCSQLQGFVGADWIAEEYLLTPERVQEVYQVDVKQKFTSYEPVKDDVVSRMVEYEGSTAGLDDGKSVKGLVRVWEIQDKVNQQTLTVAEGYPDFLREPAEPAVKLERFWTMVPLVFNPVEHEQELYPLSDARILMHPQNEYNANRQGLREHRIANRPFYGAARGVLSSEEKDHLSARPAHAVIEFNALNDRKLEEVVGAFKPAPIDPALYDISGPLQDVLYAAGSQEANLGGTAGATATETSIAENSRMSTMGSNVDDIDEVLTEIARAMSELMLMELDINTVQEIVGPGAVWPEMSREQAVKELFLAVKAGSTGRPNKAAELANRERALPAVVQIPGSAAIAPQLLKDYLELLDIDYEGAAIDSMPSIVALNAAAGKAMQPATGDQSTDPTAQGGQGAQNAPKPDQMAPGPQPQHTPPGAGQRPENVGP